jgi:hypothetical protein
MKRLLNNRTRNFGKVFMKRRLLLCLLFFGLSPLVLGFTVYLSNFSLPFSSPGKILGENVYSPQPASSFFAAYEQDTGIVVPTIRAEDSTPLIIENYLRHYNSPLLPYKDKIVKAAQLYGVKPSLIVAIAQQESNLGKKSPESCFNAWGWGIHERGTRCFASWSEAIEVVTRGIARDYCAQGLCNDPCLMMKKYAPKSNGSWCAGVNRFLNEMETNF